MDTVNSALKNSSGLKYSSNIANAARTAPSGLSNPVISNAAPVQSNKVNSLSNSPVITPLDTSLNTSISTSTHPSFLSNADNIPQFNLRTGAVSMSGLNNKDIKLTDSDTSTTPSQSQHSSENDQPITLFNLSPFDTSTSTKKSQVDESNSISTVFADDSEFSETSNVDEKALNPVDDEQVQKENTEKQQEAIQQENIEQQQAIDLQVTNELKARDIEVKTHEQAHAAVGGSFAKSPTYTYEKGPDGKRYAVEGEVSIDVSTIEGDPQATYNKMQKVYAAAMAPVQPSSADISVAAEATRKMNEAKQELVLERQDKIISTDETKHINDLGLIFDLAAENHDQQNHSQNVTEDSHSTNPVYQPINIAV